MKLTEILDAYHANELAIARHFGLDSLHYQLRDLSRRPWKFNGTTIVYAYGGPDELGDNGYDGDLYGTGIWNAGGFTLFVVVNNNDKELWLLDDKLRVQ